MTPTHRHPPHKLNVWNISAVRKRSSITSARLGGMGGLSHSTVHRQPVCRSYVIKLDKWCKKKNRNFTFKIAFFWVLKNDNILSSKSYTVTKSEISPQRKLRSLRNLKLKFIRHLLTNKKIFMKIGAWMHAHEL